MELISLSGTNGDLTFISYFSKSCHCRLGNCCDMCHTSASF